MVLSINKIHGLKSHADRGIGASQYFSDDVASSAVSLTCVTPLVTLLVCSDLELVLSAHFASSSFASVQLLAVGEC